MASATAQITIYADEYWEARGHDLAAQVEVWLENYYGSRCPEAEISCVVCQKWGEFDRLFKEEVADEH